MNKYFLFRYIDDGGIEHSRKIKANDCDKAGLIIAELKSFLVQMNITTYEQMDKKDEL